MRNAAIVAGRDHAVVAAQFVVAARQVLPGVLVKVAECRREAVAAMLAGSPAKRPQRVLQAFRQSDETLAAEHDMPRLEAGIGEPEMVEPVIEWLARDRDAGGGHVGEIRQSHAPGYVNLPEDDLLFLAMDGAPGSDPALDRAANASSKLGMTPDHLIEDGDRPDAGSRPQQRHDLGVENLSERIGPAPLPRNLLLRGQPQILLDATGRGRADRPFAAATAVVLVCRNFMKSLIW